MKASSHAIKSLKKKASVLPRTRREKKKKSEESNKSKVHKSVSTGRVEPVRGAAPMLQPYDIPRPVHATKGRTAEASTSKPVRGTAPTLQPYDIPRPVHTEKGKTAGASTSKPVTGTAPTLQHFDKKGKTAEVYTSKPVTATAPTLQPFDKKGKTAEVPTSKTAEVHASKPVTATAPTRQSFDISRPVTKGKTAEVYASKPVTATAPTFQPFDVPRPVDTKGKAAEVPASKPVTATAPKSQPFDIPRPVDTKGKAAEVAASNPVTATAPTSQPFDIPRPVDTKGKTAEMPASKPVTARESPPTPQPFDIPKPVHAQQGKTASMPVKAEAGPTLQPFDIPRPVQTQVKTAEVPTRKTAASVPVKAQAGPTLQPFDIPKPVHAQQGKTAASVPVKTNAGPTLQSFDIPKPVYAQKGNTASVPVKAKAGPTLQSLEIPKPVHAKKVQTATVRDNMPVPILQPIDIPRPVKAKAAQPTTKQTTGVALPAFGPAPTLQPFEIPRPVHAKKGNGNNRTKKDVAPAARGTQGVLPATQRSKPVHLVNQTQNLAATALPYPPRTNNPLFPPIPTYGPSTLKNHMIWTLRQFLSYILSGIGIFFILIAYARHGLEGRFQRLFSKHPLPPRPFQEEENRRAEIRKLDSLAWMKREFLRKSPFPDIAAAADVEASANIGEKNGFIPTEGGPDKFVVDVGYYARRVGLDCEDFKVQTEDGFVLDLWHVYDPREYVRLRRAQRRARGPENIDAIRAPSRVTITSEKGKEAVKRKQKFPVLMMPGLMQSSGVYCTNDDHSLAFWLCKQGFDVWLGNNRCGFNPKHVEFKKSDPRMWAWNITHMATLDLPALTARVLSETSSPKLGLVGHSQGTTQTLIALSKHQRPSLSSKLSVFCALAPAVYGGPLLDRMHFRFLRIIPVSLFRLILGVKNFLPMITTVYAVQGKIPQSVIGGASYAVYNYLFGWGDSRWDRGVRDRCFMFAPTFISVEAMKWWLSRDGFAGHGCILQEEKDVQRDVEEDLLQDYFRHRRGCIEDDFATELLEKHIKEPRESQSWFQEEEDGEGAGWTPPMAFWVAGDDTLCDGRELLNRFERGREPGVRVLEGGMNVIDGYSHLDVVWACDVIEKVGWGVRDAIWSTVGKDDRERWRVPIGVEGVRPWVDDRFSGGGRRRVRPVYGSRRLLRLGTLLSSTLSPVPRHLDQFATGKPEIIFLFEGSKE
ncbi:hypothetical protein VTL71DRAFT_13984 [Oculimacula yallundae]|uniref:Partial AB-hydrolase lipase domain-containing protein n=1 Tax=Oculimacula yallundae TaxID=86028 RepID=A0ABR4CNR2_9HELO